jgi:hypothetical protein
MLALPDVLHLFAHELAGLGRRRFPFSLGPTGALDRLPFWHVRHLVCRAEYSIGPSLGTLRVGR